MQKGQNGDRGRSSRVSTADSKNLGRPPKPPGIPDYGAIPAPQRRVKKETQKEQEEREKKEEEERPKSGVDKVKKNISKVAKHEATEDSVELGLEGVAATIATVGGVAAFAG